MAITIKESKTGTSFVIRDIFGKVRWGSGAMWMVVAVAVTEGGR